MAADCDAAAANAAFKLCCLLAGDALSVLIAIATFGTDPYTGVCCDPTTLIALVPGELRLNPARSGEGEGVMAERALALNDGVRMWRSDSGSMDDEADDMPCRLEMDAELVRADIDPDISPEATTGLNIAAVLNDLRRIDRSSLKCESTTPPWPMPPVVEFE